MVKKLLNGLGIFGSVILTILLTFLIFIYAIILNVKGVIGKNGMVNTFKKLDIVETLKTAENGTMWEDFKGLAETLNLNEEQFEQILNNKKIKEQIGSYIGEVISSAFNDNEANLSKERMENFLNTAIDEYNKVSDTKINDIEREKIVNSFDEEMIANMNEEFSSINLKESVDSEYVKYIEFIDGILFGSYTFVMLVVIMFIICLIGLFRFSFYKWIPYVKTSTVISGLLMLMIGLLILVLPLRDMAILITFKKIIVTNIFITSAVLFIISIGLSIGKKYLKRYIDKKSGTIGEEEKLETKELKEEVIQVNEKKEKKKVDKKTIIIILLVIIILLIILFLIFGRKGSYTITFDTNGGSLVTNIEVNNNEIVKLPEPPTKEGYKFVGWVDEDGKVITNGTKVTDDINLKAEWISNKAKTNIIKIDTDGGNEIDDIIIEKGEKILLPVNPTRDGYVFVGWLNEKGNLITNNMVVTNNVVIKALWMKKGTKTSTLKFDTDGGNNIENIIVEKGKVILLPINPTKSGYAFAGWVDEDGNTITKDTIVNKNITIKAIWKQPYTCPSGCTPIGDGSKCIKTTTKEMVTYTGCPTGTETIEKFCSSHKKQISIGFDEDQFYETVGIMCDDNPKGFCVDYNGRYYVTGDTCPSGYYKYIETEGLGAVYGCTKKYDKGGTGCPSGYTKNGSKCIKKETLKCKSN